jgi:hypothetical protein
MSTPLDTQRLALQNLFPSGKLLGALAATESQLRPNDTNAFRKQTIIQPVDYTSPGNNFKGVVQVNPVSTRVDVRNNITQY